MKVTFQPAVFSLWVSSVILFTILGGVAAQPSGVSQRLANSTITLPERPGWSGYQLVNAFGTNTFFQPVCIASPPGETNRVFVCEKTGIIQVVSNLAAMNPIKSVYLNLQTGLWSNGEAGLLGLAFHPGFGTNGYFYVYRSVIVTNVSAVLTSERLSRFQAARPDSATVSADTEVILFDQYDPISTHNGGDLHFAADGYLYVSVGDGSAGSGAELNSQTIRKGFQSGILRLDVDKRPENLRPNSPSTEAQLTLFDNYFVPNDNPFVNNPFPYERFPDISTNSIRTEFWAIGFRNPWRFSIDPLTGWIWVGDVGDTTREEIDIVVKGGNYGWGCYEGTQYGRIGAPPGFTSIAPIYEYNRDCVIGGAVYRGTSIPQLTGAYVFCDYVRGNIWSFRYDGSTVSDFQELLQNGSALIEPGITAFGTDPRNGDILLADVDNHQIRRLVYRPNSTGPTLPATLTQTGIFASDTSRRTPQDGLVSYEVNVSAWSEATQVSRWFVIPNTNLTIGWSASNNWSFPTGTVWVQHFDLLTNAFGPAIPVETRVLVSNSEGVYGVSYRWTGSTNEARLVADEGASDLFLIVRSSGVRPVYWRYPSQGECRACHNSGGGLALGFNTAQLNRNHVFNGFPGATGALDNQLHTLAAAGYFSGPITDPTNLPALAVWNDTSASVEWRARSYLTANCANCHQLASAAEGFWDARYFVPTAEANIIWGPLKNNFGNSDEYVVAPQSLANSMLYQRLAGSLGPRMPPVFMTRPDNNDMNLVAQWIGSLTNSQPVRLAIAPDVNVHQVNISWHSNALSLDLYSATNLATPWSLATNPATLSNGQWMISLPAEGSSRFFRLQSQ